MLYATTSYGLDRSAPIYEPLLPRLLVTVHGALLFFLVALIITALIVRSTHSVTYIYRLVTSLALYALAVLVDLIHYSLVTSGRVGSIQSAYNLIAILSVIFVQASWLVMLVCILSVLHNRLLVVWPGPQKVWVIGHATLAGAMGVLAVCDLAVTANWVSSTMENVSTNEEVAVQRSKWQIGLTFARAQEIIYIIVLLYVFAASAAGGWFSRKRDFFSHNLFTLTFTSASLILPCIFALVGDHYTVFGAHVIDPITLEPSMRKTLNSFLAANLPLLFAYVGLVVIGKRGPEFVGQGKGRGKAFAEEYGDGAARGFYALPGQV